MAFPDNEWSRVISPARVAMRAHNSLRRGGRRHVSAGRLSIESSPDLRDHLLAVLRRQSPPETIAIDLTAVSYMDTSGIATLIEGLKIARIGGIAMRLRGLQGRLLHLFQATGIGSLFD